MDFDKYIRIILDDGRIKGRNTIATLVAIGAAESGLDNFAVGDNVKNGTTVDNPALYGLGLGWLQHDSYWLKQDEIVNGLEWSIEGIRQDPAESIDLLYRRPGMILYEGPNTTYVRFGLWATFPQKSDEFMDEAEAAYDRVIAERNG